jgi:hypothetical protein
MKNSNKSTLIIIGSVLLGVIIGFFSAGIVRNEIIENRRKDIRTPKGFSRQIARMLNPEESQKEAINNILEQHHKKVRAVSNEFSEKMDTLRKELLDDMRPILSERQYNKLKQRLDRPPHGKPPFGKRHRMRHNPSENRE